MSLIRENSSSNRQVVILVFDTSAFLAKYHLQIPDSIYKIYTTPSVVSEVRDAENKQALEIGIMVGRIIVQQPLSSSIDKAKETAKRIGEITSLSKTDIEVAALALEKSINHKVVVITDDYSLQNLLYHLRISFKPLRTRGIKKIMKYKAFCPVCGYIPSRPGEDTCPLCGSKMVRRKTTFS